MKSSIACRRETSDRRARISASAAHAGAFDTQNQIVR
jgi:hypothetical protein